MSESRRGKKRRSNGREHQDSIGGGLQLHPVEPLTDNQRKAYRAWSAGKHLMLHGVAGTGKTLVSLYLALKELETGYHDRVVLIRSAVPTRDQGFLPGSLKEKSQIYELPFSSACADIYHRGDAYGILKGRGTIEFITTSYVRGITLNDCVVIVDEVQNMKFHEIASVVTRIGQNSRLVVLGDFRQSDLVRSDERRGIGDFLKVVDRMGTFELVEFGYDDILRSDMVREFLIARDELGITD